VKDDCFSGAAPHDSNFIDELTKDERTMVVADSAYRSYEREPGLESRGVCGAFALKRPRGQPDLPPMLKKLNRLIAQVRPGCSPRDSSVGAEFGRSLTLH
jgi:hypothetical protein